MTTTKAKGMAMNEKHIRIIAHIKRVCPYTIDKFLEGSMSMNMAIESILYHSLIKSTYNLSTSELKQLLTIIKLQHAVEL